MAMTQHAVSKVVVESELGTGLLEAEWKNSDTNYLPYISWLEDRKRPVVAKY